MTEREKLRKLAEAATPGPWEAHHVRLEGVTHWYVDSPRVILVSDGATPKDSAYIAAANPAAVIDLLDQLDAAEAKLAETQRMLVVTPERFAKVVAALGAANAKLASVRDVTAELNSECDAGFSDPFEVRSVVDRILRAIDGEPV